ncbi:universal stress protein [Polymorphobacter glacialis]|uniref:Universal stress protein n=1 Tax=Sandarakinorhabdus glacialis TaxID=1614636 RepID=A0A916ZSK1_9SPHN|nr:universal stress protein [Polymorphobacter glacialis]GGE11996.1 universal stress protein [Polymorphobacter glacialis]
MKTILVPVNNDEGQGARLQAAFDLARAFGGHLTCLQVTPYTAYALGEPSMGAFPVTAMIEAIEQEKRNERTAVEAQLAQEGIGWDWITRDGDAVERVREAARLADVVVMNSGPFGKMASMRLAVTGDVAIHAPSPVVAVPTDSHGLAVTGAALVAWDGSQEAAKAMRSALPMLRLAESVDILTVEEKETDYRARDAAAWLSRHGVGAEVIERGSGGQTIESVIRDVLAERQSAWLVQGAYGHSRWRQTLFGGVTRGLLADAPVPLVLSH